MPPCNQDGEPIRQGSHAVPSKRPHPRRARLAILLRCNTHPSSIMVLHPRDGNRRTGLEDTQVATADSLQLGGAPRGPGSPRRAFHLGGRSKAVIHGGAGRAWRRAGGFKRGDAATSIFCERRWFFRWPQRWSMPFRAGGGSMRKVRRRRKAQITSASVE